MNKRQGLLFKGLNIFSKYKFYQHKRSSTSFWVRAAPKAGRNTQQEHVQILTDYLVFRQKIIIFLKEFPDNMIIEL